MKRIGPKYLNACSLNGTTHAEKQAETGCTLGFALDYYFSQVTLFFKLFPTRSELLGLYGHTKLKGTVPQDFRHQVFL
jgi:hypothetical protein